MNGKMGKVTYGWTIVYAVFMAGSAFASTETLGPNGINSAGLKDFNGMLLDGTDIDIGQLEARRPGDPNFDTNTFLFHSSVEPEEVFFRNEPPPSFDATINDPNANEIDQHAVQVAGVMISSDTSDPDGDGDSPTGVSPGASLFSVGWNAAPLFFDSEIAISAQHLAKLPGQDIRATNMSFAIPLDTAGGKILNGNQLLTQFIDWSAAEHDILYIVAGNQNSDTDAIPTDNFNGMSIASSGRVGGTGKYLQVAMRNRYDQDAEGDRTSIDLIAPGENVKTTTFGDTTFVDDGTSFAVPHVTGTVALLQEYGDERITASAANWGGTVTSGPTAQRHEVMKAVLMNSADKLIDDGTVTVPFGLPIPAGGLLGMDRTVLKQDGTSTWFDSISWDDSVDSSFGGDYPLDEEMGAGHLNAKRALQQFAAGEHEEFGVAGGTVPVIGWDYGTTTGENDINRYRFNQELQAGSFVVITLAWDREVEFDVDVNMDGEYDIGDSFVEYDDSGFFPDDDVINDLDLYFQPAFAGNVNQARAYSASGVGTVEHIFFQVETTGEFEFWVVQEDEDVGMNQDYAVAWWALGTGPLIAGDFDNDGDVDGADFLTWQRNMSVGSLSDWENNYGMTSAVAATTAVPEPATCLLLAMGLAFWRPRSSRNRVSQK